MSTTEPPQGPSILDLRANLKALSRIVVLLAVLGGGVWLFLRFTAGEKAANQVAATVLRQPIELKNSVESLPAGTLKGFGLTLPYPGSLVAEVSIPKGNEVNIYLVAADQMDKVKGKKPFNHFQDFEATKTMNYRRSGRLAAGNYYLVVIDNTLGILSASSSDVRVHLRLEP